MYDTQIDGEEMVFSLPDRRLWTFLFVMVAISLWAQWLGPGALAEVHSEDGSGAVLALQLLPFCAVAAATSWHHPMARLALIPVSFLPGLALLPDAEWEALSSPGSLTLSMATFALYLIVAAAAPSDFAERSVRRRQSTGPSTPDRFAEAFQRFVVVRMAVMAIIFVVITYALYFAPSTGEALMGLGAPGSGSAQQVFMVVAVYFGWVIAVYVGMILPALNWEYDRRRSAQLRMQRALLANRPRLRRRVSMWLVMLMMATAIVIWILGF